MTDLMTEGYIDGFADERDGLPQAIVDRGLTYCAAWLQGVRDRKRLPRVTVEKIREGHRAVKIEEPSI